MPLVPDFVRSVPQGASPIALRWPGVNVLAIDDERDGRLEAYRNVPDPELLARRQLFVAEGRLVVRRLLTSSGLTPRSVLVTQPALASLLDVLARWPTLPVYLVPQGVMDGVAGFNVHRGCLGLGDRPTPPPWGDLARTAGRLAVLERVGNPDNVGAIFRSAAAFGLDGILLETACADPLYRKAIRTSMGATLTLPYAHAEPWPEVLRRLAADAWTTVAMVTASEAPPLRDALPGNSERVAIVIGHEGEGLTAQARSACGREARIPVSGDVDSLNAAAAAAIAFYEIQRSRRGAL